MYSKHSYSLFLKVTCIMGRIFSPRFGISETIWGRNSTPERTDGFDRSLHHNPPSHFSTKKPPKRCLVLDFWNSILNTKRGSLVWYSSWGPTPSTLEIHPLKMIVIHLQKSSRWTNFFKSPCPSSWAPQKRLTKHLEKWTRNPEFSGLVLFEQEENILEFLEAFGRL